MRSALFALATAAILASVGCHHNLAKNSCGCDSCSTCDAGGQAHGLNRRPTRVATLPHGYLQQREPAGPPSASFGYPYYTTRAPRDFLMDNPPGIGY